MCTKKTGVAACVVLSLVLGLIGPVHAQVRYWHTRDGRQVLGEYEKEVFGNCYFRKSDGRLFKIAKADLIDSDVKYINAKTVPKLTIKFSRDLHEIRDLPPDYDASAFDDKETEVTGTVEVRKVGKAPYTGTLRGEMYLIAEEVATDDYRLFGKKGFAITFPDPNSEVFQTSLMKRLRTWDDTEIRGARYKGYVVIVETADGERLAFASNLSWMKEKLIETLRKIPCPGFMDKECNKRPVPRPTAVRIIDPVGGY